MHVFKICVLSDTCLFSKRVCFLAFDNTAENQNYSLNSCRVKMFHRTDDRRHIPYVAVTITVAKITV